MSKFKVGDKVRCIHDQYRFNGEVSITVGTVLTIVAVLPGNILDFGYTAGYASSFELVPDFSNQSSTDTPMNAYNSYKNSPYVVIPMPTTEVSRKCSCEFAVIWREGCKCKGV